MTEDARIKTKAKVAKVKTKAKTAKAAAVEAAKPKRFGTTWWGKRWIEALEHLSRDYLSHLGRGRVYARTGRVRDMSVTAGQVTAQVHGSESEPYEVSLRVAVLPPASWRKVIEAMSKQAVFAAELLNGRMPANIEDAFRAAGHSVFPGKQRELEADCTCADWASPCKHVAAVHYILGEAFDKDPFLLFELRGRNRGQVLGALRAARASDAGRSDAADAAMLARITASTQGRASPSAAAKADIELQSVDGIAAADFDRSVAPLPSLEFHIEAPALSGTLLRQLGSPPSWNDDDIAFQALIDIYRAASRRALALALAEPLTLAPQTRRRRREVE